MQFTALVGKSADALQSYTDQPEAPGRWRNFVPPESLAGRDGR
jgi:hypothetical protein